MTKQLTSGIDKLVLALDVQWKDEKFFEILHSIKDRAIKEEKENPGIIHYRDKKAEWIFSVRPYGIRGYEWFLTSKDFIMRIGNWTEPKSRPSIMIEISSEALWRVGAKEIYERIVDIITACEGIVITAKVSRVDLCMDLLLEVDEWDDFKLRKQRVCRGRKIGIYLDGDTLETFSVGIGDITFRLYDKVREIEQVSKKTWMYDLWKIKKSDIREDQRAIRVEFQIRREIIKQLGAGNVDEFFKKIDEVWAYCTREWLQFKDSPEREHKYRNTVPWWQVVQENFMGVQNAIPAIRKKAIKMDAEQLRNQMLGLASSFTALKFDEYEFKFSEKVTFQDCISSVMDYCQDNRCSNEDFIKLVERKRAKYSRILNQ